MARRLKDDGTRLLAFEFARPHYGYYGFVERTSVLTPVVRHRRGAPRPPVAELAQRLVLACRASLRARSAAGEFDETRCRTMGNCRPVCIVVKPQTNFCKQSHICPHCWSRRAADSWLRIDRALFPQREDGTRPRKTAYTLVVARRFFGVAALAPYQGALSAVAADRTSPLQFGQRRVIPGRGYELKKLSPVGSLDVLTLVPRYRKPAGWQASLRQVFVVEPGRELDIPGAAIRRIESPSRKQVAKAVARAWRYPRGLLLCGHKPAPVGIVANYLMACKGRRMWATYGVFNEGQPWSKELHALAKQRAAEKRAVKQAAAKFP
jgi:hypothetical protein